MKSDVVETLRGFKNYLGEGVIVAALGFAMTPILTRVMSVSDYGILNVFLSYVSIATILFTLNVHSSVGRYFYEQQPDFPQFLGSIILFSSILFVTFSLFFIYFTDYPPLMITALLFLTLAAIVESIFRQIYQARLESHKIAFTSVFKTSMIFLFILSLVFIYAEGGVNIPIFARMLAGSLVLIYFVYAISRYIGFGIDRAHFKYCIFYAVPLIPYALSNIVLAHFDRIMLQEMVGSASAGLYSFAYNIGFIMSLVVAALNSSFYPIFFAKYNDKAYEQHDQNVFKTQNIVMLAFVFLLLFAEEIGLVLGPNEYAEAMSVVPAVVLGYVFYSFFSIYNRNFDFSKKTYISTSVMVLSVMFNIVANYLLIPKFGYMAAAYTTLGSYFLLFLLSWFASNYILKIHSIAVWGLVKPLLKLLPVLVLSFIVKQLELVWYYSGLIDTVLLLGAIWTIYPNTLVLVNRILVKVK